MDTNVPSPSSPDDPAPRIDPATVLGNTSATIRELTAAARVSKRELQTLDGEIESLADERRDEPDRQMKAGLRSEINELRDLRAEHQALLDKILERVEKASSAKVLSRAQRNGQDGTWVAKHAVGLTTQLQNLKAKIGKGLKSKTETVKAKWKPLGEELNSIASLPATDSSRLEKAESFLQTHYPLLHAHIAGQQKATFIDEFLKSLQPSTTK